MKIKTEKFYRSFEINRKAIDEDKRTVELAFSSEEPVTRWFGDEILDHSPESIRMGRMNNGAAVLVDHDPSDHIGVVESVSLSKDRRGRAVVRFGRGQRAEEIYQDVKDGIRPHVSVGYAVHRMQEEKEGVFRVNDWEPFEISIVSIPADPSVGIGRAENGEIDTEIHYLETKKMSEEKQKPTPAAKPEVDIEMVRNQAREAEQKRVADILSVGEKHDAVDLAREYIAKGKEVADFNAALLERKLSKPKKEVEEQFRSIDSPDIGMTDKEAKRFSFVRALNFLANPGDRRAREAAKFEIEASEAASEKMGRSAQGIIVPADVMKRDLTVGTTTAGGHTVSTDLLAGSFIDVLRNMMVTDAAGATMLTDLVGNIAIPRQTAAATAYWVAESGAPTESQQAFDQVTMSPKTVGAYTDISRKLLLQSSIDIENFVRADLARVLAIAIDLAGLYGTGADNQPEGIVNTSGIGSVTFGAADPDWGEIVDLESAVATDNALMGSLAYIADAVMMGAFKQTEKSTGSGQYIAAPDGSVNGYNCFVTNQMTDGDVLFGNFADLLIGMWGGLDLTVDPYSNSTSGTVRIVGLQDVDIAVRHPESFALGNDGV